MHNAERAQDIKDQLSDIAEEKSEVHNISSIKSSHFVQNLQVNQQFCFLCTEPNIDLEPDKPLRSQNVLIFPCLCNKMAHRDCMKRYLLQTQAFSCEICKANYAVGKSSNKILTHITPSLITSWLATLFFYFLVMVAAILMIIYVHSFDETSQVVDSWKNALIGLFSFVLLLMIIYMIFVVRWTVQKLKGSDIEVYCNQTEIALHCKNSKEILEDYYDNVAQLSVIEDISNVEDGDESQRDIYEPTNASLLQTKGGRYNPYYPKENYEAEKILGRNDYEGEFGTQKRFQREEPSEGIELPSRFPEVRGHQVEAFKFENIGKVKKETRSPRKFPEEIYEEVSSIKADTKANKNNEISQSVEIVLTADLQDNEKVTETDKKRGKEKPLEEEKESCRKVSRLKELVQNLREHRESKLELQTEENLDSNENIFSKENSHKEVSSKEEEESP